MLHLLVKPMKFCVAALAVACSLDSSVIAQGDVQSDVQGHAHRPDYRSFDVSSVYDALATETTGLANVGGGAMATPWWDQHVTQSQRRAAQPLPTDIHSLMYLALKYSNEIRIAAEDPIIRETAIAEADSNFDWVRYLDASWNDTNEPISNSLTTGDQSQFFDEQTVQAQAGLRRNTRTGGRLDVSQRYGFQDNNSTFFIPSDQATGQLTVSYSHPLMRGRGAAYNNSLVVLSQLDAGVAQDEFLASLQDHLLEVTRSYWALYQERSALAQQTSLFLKTQDIVKLLRARQAIDAQKTQFITASSALESRRSDLIRARTAVVNAETRLRGLINAPELNVAQFAEIVPVEQPVQDYFGSDLQTELETAMQNRPEVHAAIKQVRSASVRLGVAQNEMLPLLNLVTQGYLSGLRGDNDFGGALRDQFSTGQPSYSVGIQYEMPIGNRLSRSRLARRRVEMRQLQRRYALALTAIQTEVDIAVREMNTSWQEIQAKGRALAAAEAETKTIEARWSKMADGSGSSSLNLESLLRAQERVTDAERDYVTSLLTYNLSIINLKKATGTLLQSENVTVGRQMAKCDAPSLYLDKSRPGQREAFEESAMPCQTCTTDAPASHAMHAAHVAGTHVTDGQVDVQHVAEQAHPVQQSQPSQLTQPPRMVSQQHQPPTVRQTSFQRRPGQPRRVSTNVYPLEEFMPGSIGNANPVIDLLK